MLSRRAIATARREVRDLARVAPLIAVAIVLSLWVAPSLVTFAADHFQSPTSPVSPSLLPPTVPAPARVTQPAVVAPEVPTPPPSEPTEAPPPPPPVVPEPVAGTPPTLWIVLGLLVVGVVVVALVFLRRPEP